MKMKPGKMKVEINKTKCLSGHGSSLGGHLLKFCNKTDHTGSLS